MYVQLDGLSLSYGDRTIFADVHFTVSPGTRIALTGANGSGKSTLMKATAGMIEWDSGRIISPKDTEVAYLPQSDIVHTGRSLIDEALSAFDHLARMETEAQTITEQLEKNTLDHVELLSRYQKIQDILENAEWDGRWARIERVLKGLGFKQSDFDADVDTFSGGWQMRIALSKILLKSPDILLLDEPTNYLDIEAREWLRDFIRRFQGGVILVSHDRSFLDSTCNQVAEILMGRVNIFKGIYSEFEAFRKKEMESLITSWKRQQEEIARIETFINRFRYKESKAIQVQSRIKMLEKLERIEIPPSLKHIHLRFPEAPHSGKITVRGESLARSYGEVQVFQDLNIELPRGSRTAVVGVNGAGKTTLLRILSGSDHDYCGKLQYGNGVKRGYFSQNHGALLDGSLTVIQEASENNNQDESKIRGLLGAFLFSGDDVHKKVGVLSGGERNRLALLKLLLEPVNLLILDEPTNHLDITSKDVLLNALMDFGGTLVIVSHDRYFLEHIADRVLEIESGRAQFFLENYVDYRQRKNNGNFQSIQKIETKTTGKTTPESRERYKRHRSKIAQLRKEEARLTQCLEEKEKKLSEVHSELALSENYSNPVQAQALSKQLMMLEESIDQLSTAWEDVATRLEIAEKHHA